MSKASIAFKKVKLQSISKLKHETDKYCSLYTRQSAADKEGCATCYTCGAKKHWKELQAGHFISRNHSKVRYDVSSNIRIQCVGCNIWGHGKYVVFTDKLLQELGTRKFKELLRRGRETHQFTRQELAGIIQDFKKKLEELENL